MLENAKTKINAITLKAFSKCSQICNKQKDGFDGLIVTIGLILLVMVLILVFKDTIVAQIKSSISSVSDEIGSLSTWSN